jgi:hypothetical protein
MGAVQQPYQYQGITPPPAQPMGAAQQPYQYQSVATQPEPMAQNIYAPPNYPAQSSNTAQSSNAAQSANAFNKKKGKKKLIIALAVAIPIVLICGVIAGLLIYKHQNTNTVGNTPGNLANGGLAAQQGDWIYYSSYSVDSDGTDNYSLCKIRTDGTGKTKLSNIDSDNDINVVGDWIYYTNASFYKMHTDGTDNQKVN